jgi:hypothetical protein
MNIFWSQIDDSVIDFPIYNIPMQKISNNYPVYFAYSGDRCGTELKKYYPNATFVRCNENSDNKKAEIVFKILKHVDYSALIRTCCDSVITDVEWLVRVVDEKIGNKHALMGNVAKDNGDNGEFLHVRGGCNAANKSIIDNIKMGFMNEPFDKAFSLSAIRAGADIIDYKLFGVFETSVGKFPVCHPDRSPMQVRLEEFKRIVNLSQHKAVKNDR